MKILRATQVNIRPLLIISASFLVLIFLPACKDSGTSPEDVEIVLPDGDLNYFDHMQELFVLKCASRGGCHSSSDRAGNLDLTDYQDITTHVVGGSVPLVLPGNGQSSFLYLILRDNYLGTPRMPLDGPYLNTNHVEGVKRWIDGGVKYSN